MKIEQKNLNFSKTQYFSKNSKFSKNSFFFKKLKFSEKSKFSKFHIPSTAFFIYKIALFTTKVSLLVYISTNLKTTSGDAFLNVLRFFSKSRCCPSSCFEKGYIMVSCFTHISL